MSSLAGDHAGLADAVGVVGGLVFDRGIPPGIELIYRIGAGEVEADAARFETDQEHGDGGEIRNRATSAARSRVEPSQVQNQTSPGR